MKAVLCPVCNGRGLYYEALKYTAVLNPVPCHGCAEWGSRGWIVIDDDTTTKPIFPHGDRGETGE